jgi:voltage-gated potassium channel
MIKKKILYLVLIFVSIIIISSFLYSYFENLNTIDSIYITIITLTSLGFSKLFPHTQAGKILTMTLALGGYTFLAGIITIISSTILEGKILQNYRRKKMEKKISSYKNHILVCGGGEAGKYVIEELYKTKGNFVLIDKDEHRVNELLKDYPNLKYIIGDATDDNVLSKASIANAKGIIVVLPSDTENLYVIVTAKSRNPGMQVISQVIDESNHRKLLDAGADRVISTNSIIGTRLASLLLRPSVVAFLDVVNSFTNKDRSHSLRLEEVKIPAKSSLIGKNIAFARIPHKAGLIIIAISKQQGEFLFNPSSVYEFEKNDKLIVLGNDEQILTLKKLVKE